MTKAQDFLVEMLRKAHAMEKRAETVLESQASRFERYPGLRRRFEEHAARTRRQAGRLEQRLARVGSNQSAMKDAAGKIGAVAQDFRAAFADDDVVEGALSVYANLHYEIGRYRTLVEAAAIVEDGETISACRENMREDEEMAAWLAENLNKIARDFLDIGLASRQSRL